MKGHISSIEIGSHYGSAKERKSARVTIRHGPEPKPSKSGSPAFVGTDAPSSTVHMSEEKAKRFSRGQKVQVHVEPDMDDLPKFKSRAERDRYLESFSSADDGE